MKKADSEKLKVEVMRHWFVKNLGDGMLASEPLHDIKTLLITAFANVGNPQEMAAFSRHESEGHLHCEVKVYFSPATAEVAKNIGAKVCGKPEHYSLSLLVGSKSSWHLLFPEHNQ